MKLRSPFALALSVCLMFGLLSGCAPSTVQELTPTTPSEVRSLSHGEDTSPAARFGLALMGEASRNGQANPVLSPLSAYVALSMAAAGADGTTAAQFDALLAASDADRDALCQALSAALADTEGSTRLELAQSVWVQEGAHIKEDYLSLLSGAYGAQAFSAELCTPAARRSINGWVNERTHGLIPTLLEENLDEDAVLVLLNTLYFKGTWETEFDPNDTSPGPFTNENGTVSQVDFLRSSGPMAVAENDRWEGVLLPYDDGKTVFLALKPKGETNLRALAADLTAEEWDALLSDAKEKSVRLSLPKLELEYALELKESLQALGLTDAFEPGVADFSSMGTAPDGAPLYVGRVLQKVKLMVGEEGTEAAAATAVVMNGESAPAEEPRVLAFDSSYLFAVVDLDSKVPLFLGMATGL